MPIFNICRFMMRVTVWKSETQGWSSTLVTILALSPCLPLPRGSPLGLQNPDFMWPQQEQGQVLVMRTHLSLFSTERNTKYIPMKRLQCHLITTDNLIYSAKPTAVLILLGNKILVKTTYFHLPPKHAIMVVFSLSLTRHHLPNSPQGLVQLVGICLVSIV